MKSMVSKKRQEMTPRKKYLCTRTRIGRVAEINILCLRPFFCHMCCFGLFKLNNGKRTIIPRD